MSDPRNGVNAEPTESLATEPGKVSSNGRLMIVWEGGAISRDLPAVGTLRIGRSSESDVTVEHGSVSRHHARLHIGPKIFIEDLGSANGTRVGNQKLVPHERVEVSSGELVELGATHLVVTAPSENAAPRAASIPPVRRDDAGVHSELVAGRVLHELLASTRPFAASELCVLLLGESGVGKEVVARDIHARSARSGGPFFALNCAALPEALLESELFGYERGAFTGAHAPKAGLLEAAAGGTVLLDELGELTVAMQSKFLRALENKEILRVGGLRPRAIDVRFISATSRDLEALVGAGKFRADLFYRVSGAVIRVPPLRDRIDEIGPLAELFVRLSCERRGCLPPRLGASALAVLERHAWPGNVRELRNVMERASLLCQGAEIVTEHLVFNTAASSTSSPPSTARPSVAPAPASTPAASGLRSEVEALERTRILEALTRCGGNQTRAAQILGISRRTLLSRLDEYGVPRPRK